MDNAALLVIFTLDFTAGRWGYRWPVKKIIVHDLAEKLSYADQN